MCPKLYSTLILSKTPKHLMRERLVQYALQHGIRRAARVFGCSRNTVRKWLRRHQAEGDVQERSRRPKRSPRQLAPHLEALVAEARETTGYGPHRLTDYLWRTRQVRLSPWTIRNVLQRRGLVRPRPKRTTCYPAHWAWERSGGPFRFIQADVKDVYDKGALGAARLDHLRRLGLPRYQWTFLDAHTRLRFLAYSHRINLHVGLAFLTLCVRWVRAYGVVQDDEEIVIQTDWGVEFGGDQPQKVERLNQEVLGPLGARLCRYPKGRKQYNGRVERLHRTDDEELYRPTLLTTHSIQDYLDVAYQWVGYYNLYRPHFGAGMEGRTPMERLRHLGLQRRDQG